MSVLADYFAAASDELAATAAEYVDGQPGLLDLTPQSDGRPARAATTDRPHRNLGDS